MEKTKKDFYALNFSITTFDSYIRWVVYCVKGKEAVAEDVMEVFSEKFGPECLSHLLDFSIEGYLGHIVLHAWSDENSRSAKSQITPGYRPYVEQIKDRTEEEVKFGFLQDGLDVVLDAFYLQKKRAKDEKEKD